MRVDVEGQWLLLHHFEGRGRNQIRFKIAVLATTRHPDISGAQPVTQFRECADVAERLEQEMGDEQFCFVEGCQRSWDELPAPDGPLPSGSMVAMSAGGTSKNISR